MVNKVILIGRLGKDPEIFYTSGGITVAKFSIATTEYYNKEEHTEWHNVVVFGKQAEFCQNYLQKGDNVFVEGKLQTRKWQDKKGDTRYTTEVVANIVKSLSFKKTEQKRTEKTEQNQKEEGHYGTAFPSSVEGMDDAPF